MVDQNRDNPPRHVRIIGGILIVFAVIATTLVLAEVSLRIVYPTLGDLDKLVRASDRSDSRSYLLRPNARFLFKGMRNTLKNPVVWSINAEGIRSDRPLPPRSKKFRIVTFGDSEGFGWAMPLDHTFQRHMEQIDRRIEVINLSIPGYNAENIADHMAELVPAMEPDLVFYMFHKNDIDRSLSYNPILSNSYLWIFLRMSIINIFRKDRKKLRRTPAGYRFVARQVGRMIETARRENVPLMIGLLQWKYRDTLPPPFHVDRHENIDRMKPYGHGFRLDAINLEHGWRGYPRVDKHMSHAGHHETAQKICKVISHNAENRCTPPDWRATPSD